MPELDGLRAIAVTAVMAQHWGWSGVNFFTINIGGYGVGLFFVLSGFLITRILLDIGTQTRDEKTYALKNFYARRALRIFPLYYTTLAICAACGVKGFREYAGWHALYLTNFVAFRENFDLAYSIHFWTLAVEEQFYLLWPALVMILSRRALFFSTTLLCLMSPLYRILPDYIGFPRTDFPTSLLPAQLDYLCTGAIVALASVSSTASTQKRLAQSLVLAGIIGFALLTNVRTSLGWLNHTCLAMVCGGLVSFASRGIGGPVGAILRSRPFLMVGGVSYGIYVIHMVAPAVWEWLFWASPAPMYRVLPRLGIPSNLFDTPLLRLLPYLAITFSLSALSWIVIESPFLRLKKYFPYKLKKDSVGGN